MIELLTGNDNYSINAYIAQAREKLDPSWADTNYHEVSDLDEAIATCASYGFGGQKVVVVRLKILKGDERKWDSLFASALADHAVLIVPDGAVPAWVKCSKRKFDLIPEWREADIERLIEQEVDKRELPLPKTLVKYLSRSIGSNPALIASSLDGIALCRGGGKITPAEVKELCPDNRGSVFALAAAIRDAKHKEVIRHCQNLMSQGEPPMKLVSTLITVFHQWVRVKACAECAGISNPKRLYYIRQELASATLKQLVGRCRDLLLVSDRLKSGGMDEEDFLDCLLTISRGKSILPKRKTINDRIQQRQQRCRQLKRSADTPRVPTTVAPLAAAKPWNPYDVPIVAGDKLLVDENALKLNHKPDFQIPEWKPGKQIRPYEQVRRVYLDIETLGLDPKTDRVIAVGLWLDGTERILLTDRNERELLRQAIATLESLKPQLLIGHNHVAFDLPFLIERCTHHQIKCPFRRGDKEKKMTYASVFGEPIRFYPVYWSGVSIIDTYHLVGAEDKRTAKFTSYGLKDAAIQIGARKDRRLELSHSQIKQLWESDDTTPILEYLGYDLEDTKSLADYLVPAIYYQSEVVPLKPQEISTASPAKIWEAIMEAHYGKDHLPESDTSLSYQGGYVSCNPGLYKNAAKLDVSSMYPSIQLSYGICSRKDGDKHYLAVLNYLRTQRLELKKLAKQSGEAIYKQRELALKILINGGYGFSGTNGYPFNCYFTAALVTGYGRKLIDHMIQVSKSLGAFIIEVDTDGIILSHDDPQTVFEAVQKSLPEGIKIDLDWTGRDVFVPKMKNYMLFSPDGKVKATGIFRKRNRSELQREFPIEYVRAYLRSPEQAEAYYQETYVQIKTGQYPIEKLSVTQRIPKGNKQLLELGKPGDVITSYWGEKPRYCSRTGRRLRGDRKPITSGPYFVEEYLDEMAKMRTEILQVVNPSLFDQSKPSNAQLILF